MSGRGSDLARPRGLRRRTVFYDPERFGRFSEAVARYLGTATFLVAQTALVIAWIGLNVFAIRLRWDPYPFILLNLAFSTQAAYAAPLILLAQNRQAERERLQADRDRQVTARTLADTEYLARELAAVRLGIAGLEPEPGARDTTAKLARAVEELTTELRALQGRGAGAAEEPSAVRPAEPARSRDG